MLALSLGLVLTGLLLGGCALVQFVPPPDPLAEYRPSLHPSFSIEPEQFASLLRYDISVTIDTTNLAYTGTMDLTWPVTDTEPLRELYLRLYPNLPQFGGSMKMTGMKVNGRTVNYEYAAENTAARLSFAPPLYPGQKAEVSVSFAGSVPARPAGTYNIFGQSEDVLSLTNFYPILAGRRADGWALDVASPEGDVGFHDAALYRVEITAPQDQVIAATGAEITRTVRADGWATARYVLGPAREFTLLLSPHFQVQETESQGVQVRSYFRPEDAVAGHSALYNAVAALQIYTDEFGPYPYREMTVVQAPLTFRGMEFPGMNLIGTDDYSQHLDALEKLVIHEVAHQWWYNQVGNDQPAVPWLDEGLAEWSMYLYFLKRYGQPEADRLRQWRWEMPVAGLVERNADAPIGLPVRNYPRDSYETVVYGKGALFFATLRDEIGPETFKKLLQTYLERYRWEIATPADFQALAEEVSGRDLDALFAQWVEGKGQTETLADTHLDNSSQGRVNPAKEAARP
jgi:hypothetical protein